jgi:hypothetical protein
MGYLWNEHWSKLDLSKYETFIPHFSKKKEEILIPEVFPFNEFILQSLIRQYLCNDKNLGSFLSDIGVTDISPDKFEVLGEKAFPEGHVDILIKEATPIGMTRKIIIEVKTSAATKQDLNQLKNYAEEIGGECTAAVLIAKEFSSSVIKMANDKHIKLSSYVLKQPIGQVASQTFEGLLKDLVLNNVQ